VGDGISLDQGKLAARHVAIELLAVLKAAIGGTLFDAVLAVLSGSEISELV
jgi:hypothetical protein